jgi:quinohemoprotein ethanol dehydrogenase
MLGSKAAAMLPRLCMSSLAAIGLACGAAFAKSADHDGSAGLDNARLSDHSSGDDWAGYGRTYGEQHFSPLTEIRESSIKRLGLAWSMDLPPGNPATIPLAIDGTLYFASGLNIVHAVDARSGKSIWIYDPHVPEAAGRKLRQGWGSRGIGYWDGRIYTGTGDGRLIALDAKTGKIVWSVMTVDVSDGRYITGAPRLFDGKVMIGHGGADSSNVRGYVTVYDAKTGAQLWRFYTVPGNPADGFEDQTQAMAAKTWSGEWWKYGGGGTVWNAMTYDAETDTVLIGTGNGAPWNRKVRSRDQGDNLFLCSIVALDAKSGRYKWHYQINPGETWDYTATMDMHLADLRIDGHLRKVMITAPKNGYLYVIDRLSGHLISATPIAKITWARGIDLKSGRPRETPRARYHDGQAFELWPSNAGAHSWMPSAYSPAAQLVYVPVLERGATYSDAGIPVENWVRLPGNAEDFAVNLGPIQPDPLNYTSWLTAIDPVAQKIRWKIQTDSAWNGGVLATAGNLVFQGQLNGEFDGYRATDGSKLWQFAAGAPVIAAPISFRVGGQQFVTVLVGIGTSPGGVGPVPFDYHGQARRVLTFALDGAAKLPAASPVVRTTIPDPEFTHDDSLEAQGAELYFRRCVACHGIGVISGGQAPDLRMSPIPRDEEAFQRVVREGPLLSSGMPRFEELSDAELLALRQYIRSQAVAREER